MNIGKITTILGAVALALSARGAWDHREVPALQSFVIASSVILGAGVISWSKAA